MKQFFALLAAISVVLLPVTSVFADDNGPRLCHLRLQSRV